MTLISNLRLQHVRTHRDYSADLSPNVTVITGANGSGKTSIIEAIYIALRGSSFRGSDKDIVSRESNWYRIDTHSHPLSKRTVKFDNERIAGRKQFIIDDKTLYRLPPSYRLPVVLFEPDHLRLLNGSPTRRREFIDRLISQIDPKYEIALRRYERALKQRNTLLKRSVITDDLFAWDVTLSEYGAYIIQKRHEVTSEIDAQLGQIYAVIAGTDDQINIHYSHPASGNVQQKLLNDLHTHIEKDKLLGFTSTGPHRHDVNFNFNDAPAISVASRGEIRSIVLALKFLEVDLTERYLNEKPIILLDDVFSELDKNRQKNLITEFKNHQIVITSVDTLPIKSSLIIRLTD